MKSCQALVLALVAGVCLLGENSPVQGIQFNKEALQEIFTKAYITKLAVAGAAQVPEASLINHLGQIVVPNLAKLTEAQIVRIQNGVKAEVAKAPWARFVSNDQVNAVVGQVRTYLTNKVMEYYRQQQG